MGRPRKNPRFDYSCRECHGMLDLASTSELNVELQCSVCGRKHMFNRCGRYTWRLNEDGGIE